jgi:hypothetical protein
MFAFLFLLVNWFNLSLIGYKVRKTLPWGKPDSCGMLVITDHLIWKVVGENAPGLALVCDWCPREFDMDNPFQKSYGVILQ